MTKPAFRFQFHSEFAVTETHQAGRITIQPNSSCDSYPAVLISEIDTWWYLVSFVWIRNPTGLCARVRN